MIFQDPFLLPNLMQEDDNWKIWLMEEEFMKRMWAVEG
jgi:hypothetical protein